MPHHLERLDDVFRSDREAGHCHPWRGLLSRQGTQGGDRRGRALIVRLLGGNSSNHAATRIERRGDFFVLPPVSMPEERVLVLRILEKLLSAADLTAPGLAETDVPDRVAHAARYQYGRIAQVVLAAIACTLDRGDTVVDREQFARAYLDHSHARGRDEMNPFLTDEWRKLEPGSFLQAARNP